MFSLGNGTETANPVVASQIRASVPPVTTHLPSWLKVAVKVVEPSGSSRLWSGWIRAEILSPVSASHTRAAPSSPGQIVEHLRRLSGLESRLEILLALFPCCMAFAEDGRAGACIPDAGLAIGLR